MSMEYRLWDSQLNVEYIFRDLYAAGSHYLEVQVIKRDGEYRLVASALIDLRRGLQPMINPSWSGPDHESPSAMHAPNYAGLADLLGKVVDWKKEGSVWQPKFQPGDTVIVDREGADEVKVLDVDEQAFEKVKKQGTFATPGRCTCPMQQLISEGCSCGAVKRYSPPGPA